MHQVNIIRYHSNDKLTLGVMSIKDVRHEPLFTLENPWLDNERNVSCIPEGVYYCEPYSSPKYPNVYEVKDVPNRSYILLHIGNYAKDTEGCILVGLGVMPQSDMIVGSRRGFELMKSILKDKPFKLTIGSV